jgi:hypothetical protein
MSILVFGTTHKSNIGTFTAVKTLNLTEVYEFVGLASGLLPSGFFAKILQEFFF